MLHKVNATPCVNLRPRSLAGLPRSDPKVVESPESHTSKNTHCEKYTNLNSVTEIH